ncbi:MAG: hypothetical protein AAB899_02930 [Patescibacteria group bacterium]
MRKKTERTFGFARRMILEKLERLLLLARIRPLQSRKAAAMLAYFGLAQGAHFWH